MKHYKRYISLVVLAWSILLPSAFAKGGPFTDVNEASVYAKPLTYLKEKQILTGYADGTFKPDQVVNRAETLKMLLSGLGIPVSPQEITFRDVDKGSWYAQYVGQAFKNGYVKGYPDGTFKPEQAVKRVEAMKMLLEISGSSKNMIVEGQMPFPIDEGAWYAPYVKLSLDKNLLPVFDEAQLRPGDSMNRGDIADMLYRYLSMKERNEKKFKDYEEGGVSYYDPALEGHGTSAGEQYHRNIFTAAHREYAFGTMIQVVDSSVTHSALVRVNDRGPFTAKYVIDLSESAFTSFANLSKGVFTGMVYRAGASTWAKAYIDADYFPNMHMSRTLPNMMQVGELYVMPATGSTSCMLKTPKGSNGNVPVDTSNGGTLLQLFFMEKGEYELSCGGKKASLVATDDLYSKTLKILPPVEAGLHLEYAQGKLLFTWKNPSGINLNQLRFHQGKNEKIIEINNTDHVALDAEEFTGLAEGQWTIELFGAYTSTGFSHDRFTSWASLGVVSPSFVTDFRPVTLSNDLKLDTGTTNEMVTVGQSFKFQGTALTSLKNIFFILTPDGAIEKKTLVDPKEEFVSAGKEFTLSYQIPQAGSYIFEIIRADGKPVYLYRYHTGDVYVLPRVVSMDQSLGVNALRTLMLAWVNDDRARAGLNLLTASSDLDSIAQFRSDDMVANNYFSHYDLQGKSVNDVKGKFHFEPNVAENLAYSSDGAFSAYLELRHSPSHLENILHKDLQIAGFGFTKKGNDTYVVQEFSITPVQTLNMDDVKNQWIQKANEAGGSITLSPSLSQVAQNWAEELVRIHEVTFTIGDRALLKELMAAGGKGSYTANILLKDSLVSAQTKVLEVLGKLAAGAEIGIGVAQDDTGTIKIVIGIRS